MTKVFLVSKEQREENLEQTLKDFEERWVPIDVRAAIFYRTSRVILFIWAQQDFYRTLSAGQMDRQTLEGGGGDKMKF